MNLRKLFYCAIVGVAITGSISSCQKADSSACEKLKIADQKLNENIKKYETTWDEIINQRKIELIDQKMFDKNVTLVSKPNNIVGIEAFRDYYKNYLVGFSEIKFVSQ